jgi:hypothetical protein
MTAHHDDDPIEEFRARCRGERDYPHLTELPGYTRARGDVLVELIAAADHHLTTAPVMSSVRASTGLDQFETDDAIEWLITVGLAEPALRRREPHAPALPGRVWQLLLPVPAHNNHGGHHDDRHHR